MSELSKIDYKLLAYIEAHPKVHVDELSKFLSEPRKTVEGRLAVLEAEKLIWHDLDVFDIGSIVRFGSNDKYSIEPLGAKLLADYRASAPSILDIIVNSNIFKIISFLKGLFGILATIYCF